MLPANSNANNSSAIFLTNDFFKIIFIPDILLVINIYSSNELDDGAKMRCRAYP